MFNKKKILVLGILPLLISGCGKQSQDSNGTETKTPAAEQKMDQRYQAAAGVTSQTQNNSVPLYFFQSAPIYTGKYVTVPMCIQNNSKETLVFTAGSVKLKVPQTYTKAVKKGLFKKQIENYTKITSVDFYNSSVHPTDLDINLGQNDQLQTFLTFKSNDFSHFDKNELKKSYLVYQAPGGKKFKAQILKSNVAASDIQTNLSSESIQDVGTYYNELLNDVEEARQSNQSLSDFLKQNGNSNDSLQFKMKVKQLSDNKVLIVADNETTNPMMLPINCLELHLINGSEDITSPSLVSYSIYFPQGKTTYAVVPLANKILPNGNYDVRVRPSSQGETNNSNYISTSKLPNAIEWQGSDAIKG